MAKNMFAKCPKCGESVSVMLSPREGVMQMAPWCVGYCDECGSKIYTTCFWEESDESEFVKKARDYIRSSRKLADQTEKKD